MTWRYALTGILFALIGTGLAWLFGHNPAGQGLRFDPLAAVVPMLAAGIVALLCGWFMERREQRRRDRSAQSPTRQSAPPPREAAPRLPGSGPK
jgi:hypothetical protein